MKYMIKNTFERIKDLNRFQILVFLIPVFIVIIWFSSFRQIANGEEGFSIFNSVSITDQISLWQRSGTGYPVQFYLTRLIPILMVNGIVELGIPVFLTQAAFYLFILFTGFTGMLFLAKFFFRQQDQRYKIAFIAALFYFFNLYTLSQIFNRFLYSSMFLWAYLPWFLLLWIKWLTEAKRKYLVFFLLISLPLSLSFSQPAHVLTLWTPALVWSFVSIVNKKIGNRRRVFFLTIIGFLLWLLTNSWWIYPYIKLEGSIQDLSSLTIWKSNFDSLTGVSQYFPIHEILFLKQSYIFGISSFWHSFYSNPWIVFVGIVPLFMVIIGWFSAKAENYRKYLSILAFIGLFISKGSNPPFGYVFFYWLFSLIPQTMALRNPYEKFGLVWLLPYSILFSYGLVSLCKKFGSKLNNLLIDLIIISVCGILVLPMWTGSLYTASSKVEIPKYYNEANRFLNSDKTDGRVLMLPIISGDGVRYNWSFGGVEPSEFLFDKPVVSKILRTKYFDDKYTNLYNEFVSNQDYARILEEMNIKYLVLHHDIDSEATGASSSAQVEEQLKENSNIKLLKIFEGLSVYEFIPNNDGKLFLTGGETPSNVNYNKLNATHYRVTVKDSVRPFNLIFKSTFSQLWEARINGEKINDHFLVYDYANGWRIDKTGDYIIDVVFKVWPWE